MTRFAQVTVAISDDCPGGLEGFSTFDTRFAPAVFTSAVEDGAGWADPGSRFSVMFDLVERDTEKLIDEKLISPEQAARLLNLPPEAVVPLARQRLAQINDEFDALISRRLTNEP